MPQNSNFIYIYIYIYQQYNIGFFILSHSIGKKVGTFFRSLVLPYSTAGEGGDNTEKILATSLKSIDLNKEVFQNFNIKNNEAPLGETLTERKEFELGFEHHLYGKYKGLLEVSNGACSYDNTFIMFLTLE